MYKSKGQDILVEEKFGQREMIKLQIKIMDFLPILSALGAKNIAPIDIPNNPALNTIPKDCGLIDQSFEILGAVYEITITSMPSSIFIKKQMRIVVSCSFEILLFSNYFNS